MNHDFWRQQTSESLIYPDFTWRIPEKPQDRGNFLIIGGNARAFSAVSIAYQTAKDLQLANIRILLPDALSRSIRKNTPDALFLPTNNNGGFSKKGLPEALAAVNWADSVIFIGDSSQNSETALFLEQVLLQSDKKVLIARDAIDLLKNLGEALMNRPNTTLSVSFAQLQKLFQSVYYPKVLTFSQNLTQVVENLHKFTLTYPVAIELFHQDHLFLAAGGQVITQKYVKATDIWTGKLPTRSAVYQLWSDDLVEALAASIVI